MTQEEAKQILRVLQLTYPSSYRNLTKDDAELLTRLWAKHFRNIPIQFVHEAIEEYLDEDHEFAPNIGHIMTAVKRKITIFDADLQWEWVMYIVRNVTEKLHRAPEKYLDRISQDIVDEYYLKALKEGRTKPEFEKAEFVKRYNKLKELAEKDAVKTGNLLLMSTEQKLQALGIDTDTLPRIEHKESDVRN